MTFAVLIWKPWLLCFHVLLSKISLTIVVTEYLDVCQSTGYSIITGTAKFNVVCQYWVNLESFHVLWIHMRAGISKGSTLDFFPGPILRFTNRYDETFCSPRKMMFGKYISENNTDLPAYSDAVCSDTPLTAVNDRNIFFTETQKSVSVAKNNRYFCFCRIITETDFFCRYR